MRQEMIGFWDGYSWTVCKQFAPRSRQITTTTRHLSIFTGRILFLTPNQPCQSTEEIKREGCQNCSTLCCVRQLCTVIYTRVWGVDTVIASVQDNLAKGHIAAAIGLFSRICQVAQMYTPCATHLGSTNPHAPNGILIGSAVFVGHIVVIKTQTHTQANNATLHV